MFDYSGYMYKVRDTCPPSFKLVYVHKYLELRLTLRVKVAKVCKHYLVCIKIFDFYTACDRTGSFEV
ncbi:hypothetical protein VCSRO127_2047 [Vibrio cholerae]|nr:hypothetical protein VCSRO107_1835 [Vibrio cholerae]GHX35934.1 hypothetical protein VCSRO108_1397 [Vibrio cholerae]GHY13539.1 hypothetical protein VCSRO112_3303 [Vibrio cholerae]GHZ74751.1 hypothetical protein VCSRO127_2047 [Vibrio cholerae]